MTETNKKIEWKVLKFENEDRNKTTQLGLFTLMMVIALVAFVRQDYYFAVFVFLGTMMIVWMKRKESTTHQISISDEGIMAAKEIIPYKKIQAFWIDKNKNGTNYLLIRLRFSAVNPTKIYIINSDVNLGELQLFLGKFIKEKRLKERPYEKLINRI